MRYLGIHYDIGTTTIERGTTRPALDKATIEREIGDIAGGLHANAVRITGVDVDRMRVAGEVAGQLGLSVWLSPMLPDADAETTLRAIATTAAIGQRLRDAGRDVVLVVGCELSAFMRGILPGEHQADRLALLMDMDRLAAEVGARQVDPQQAFDRVLASAVDTARARFDGPVTYASAPWETVDWTEFDIVGVDAYRDATTRTTYRQTLETYREHRRPVVVTEFGCATYRGAADRGSMAWDVVERAGAPRIGSASAGGGTRRRGGADNGTAGTGTAGAGTAGTATAGNAHTNGSGPHIVDGILRDEGTQAAEILDALGVIEDAGLEGAFVFTYIAPSYPSSNEPSRDLDAASYALVRSWPDGSTEPKAAYRVVADRFAALSSVGRRA
jgi:hypothetical protein